MSAAADDARAHAWQLLRQMLRIRRFEAACAEQYQAGRIRGFLHLYDGQEAVAVGVLQALGPGDAVVATYREHGQALARGVPMDRLMAEMYGRQQGCSGGRGGSMHVFDRERRFLGGNAIVGGGLPLAVGIALADQRLRRPAVTACFFGEGAVDEGAFHESMNLAALWQLPVLFVCENNLWSMGTPVALAESETDIARKAGCYRMPAVAVDGMDVLAVEAAARAAVAAVRAGGGPSFLECRTYRFRAHSMFDAQLYRSKAEIDQWRQRDPIAVLQQRLGAGQGAAADQLAALEAEIRAELAAAIACAEAGTLEPVADLERHVTLAGAPP